MEIRNDGAVSALLKDVALPKMFKVRQVFPRPVIKPKQIPETVSLELLYSKFSGQIKPGMRIAITAGNRGVANVAIITKSIVDFVPA